MPPPRATVGPSRPQGNPVVLEKITATKPHRKSCSGKQTNKQTNKRVQLGIANVFVLHLQAFSGLHSSSQVNNQHRLQTTHSNLHVQWLVYATCVVYLPPQKSSMIIIVVRIQGTKAPGLKAKHKANVTARHKGMDAWRILKTKLAVKQRTARIVGLKSLEVSKPFSQALFSADPEPPASGASPWTREVRTRAKTNIRAMRTKIPAATPNLVAAILETCCTQSLKRTPASPAHDSIP